MAERYVAADPYPWPFDGDVRPENTALIVIDMQIDFCGIADMSTGWGTICR
jgi:biuret amidohydrolase